MLICTICKTRAPLYKRQCPMCHTIGTLVPDTKPILLEFRENDSDSPPRRLSTIPFSTGFSALDAVIPPGLLPGRTYLFPAQPGTGKTTLTLQIAASLVRQNVKVLYISGEMGIDGLVQMLDSYRLSDYQPDLLFETDSSLIFDKIRTSNYGCVIIDSLQTIHSSDCERPSYREQTKNSLEIRNLSKKTGTIFLAISQVNKDKAHTASGPNAVLHNFDTVFEFSKHYSDSIVISALVKNRQAFGSKGRCILRKTPNGLVEKPEVETGHILRHQNQFAIGLAAVPIFDGGDATVDEVTCAKDSASTTVMSIHGASGTVCQFLSGIAKELFPSIKLDFTVRANRAEKLDRSCDLGILLAVASAYCKVPLPINTAFMGSLDAQGRILAVPEMQFRTERAIGLGYSTVYGPKAVGTEVATWTECRTIKEVVEKLGMLNGGPVEKVEIETDRPANYVDFDPAETVAEVTH